VPYDATDNTKPLPFASLVRFLNDAYGLGETVDPLAGFVNGYLGNFPLWFANQATSHNYLVDEQAPSFMRFVLFNSPLMSYLRMLSSGMTAARHNLDTGEMSIPIQLLVPLHAVLPRMASADAFTVLPVSIPLTVSENAFRFYCFGMKIASPAAAHMVVPCKTNQCVVGVRNNNFEFYYNTLVVDEANVTKELRK